VFGHSLFKSRMLTVLQEGLNCNLMRYAFRLLALACTTVCGVFSLLLLVVIPYQYILTYNLSRRLPTNPLGNIMGFHRFPIYRVPNDIKHLAPFVVGFVCFGTLYFRLARPRKNSDRPTTSQ
jgi:accessory gene regulator protein AgrB